MENNFNQKQDCPLVFVRCLTFNHEAYIEDALNGFVIQQTNFPFIVTIVNDASPDNTKNVIKTFIKKICDSSSIQYEQTSYADIIKATPNNNSNCFLYVLNLYENHFQKKSHRPYYQEYVDKAKYWAECEGDDYWTDPLKLQKQVDFMEANPDYVICSHKFKKRYMIDGHIEDMGYSSIFPEKSEDGCTFFLEQIYEKFYLQTLCVLYRRSALNEERYLAHHQIRDNVLFLEIMRNGGKGYIFNSYDGVYRIHDGGVYSGLGKEKSLIEAINLFEYIYRVFPANFTRVKLFYQYSNYISFLRLHYPWYKNVLGKRYLFYLRKRFYLIHGSLFKYAKRKLKIVLKK